MKPTNTRLLLLSAALLTTTGCVKSMLIEGEIAGTREASSAVNTLHDWEIARSVAEAGLGQLEGMHKLAPDNTDALFMLTNGWAGVSYGFTEDDYEEAHEKGDETLAEYHLARARAGYLRAKLYGLELLEHSARGFQPATKNAASLDKWLKEGFDGKEQAGDLLWTGYAWVSHVSASSEDPGVVADLWIGVALVKRSVDIDETLEHGMGHIVLGSVKAAMGQLAPAKDHLDRAVALSSGKYLPAKLGLAQQYWCVKGDRAAYDKTLTEVVDAGDELPEARLDNVIAKRRARRYLGNPVWQEECAFAGGSKQR